MSSKDKALKVMCPTCGVARGKRCVSTHGSRQGKVRPEFHGNRVRAAKMKLEKFKYREEEVEEAPKKKNPKDKLTPEQKKTVEIIMEKIEVLGKHVEFNGPVTVGPLISTYRFLPVRRTKVAHLEAMAKDFAVALGAESVLVKRMPGETAVGFFIPNKERKTIHFKDTMPNVAAYVNEKSTHDHQVIPMNFGMDSDGKPFVDDLTVQPHMLIAGATGGGKSTLEHCLVLSMAWALPSTKLRLMISDTKGVEFNAFKNLPHLERPIAKDIYETMQLMQLCVDETQTRLDKIGTVGVRNIHEYNSQVADDQKMPFWVLIIDELADLLGGHLERSEVQATSAKLQTIVQRSRASGIHVIAATQRPDVRTVKGAIKANFPCRVSFRLPSQMDSRTVLNTKGAENLMSRGDMLYISSVSPDMKRLHAPYTAIQDVKDTVESILAKENLNKIETKMPPVSVTGLNPAFRKAN
jgi:S-DNA-T family DNA segregation ATPase FtsK/SpoIIIE